MDYTNADNHQVDGDKRLYKNQSRNKAGTSIIAADMNARQEELVGIIEAFGKIPKKDRYQIKTILLSMLGDIENIPAGNIVSIGDRSDSDINRSSIWR